MLALAQSLRRRGINVRENELNEDLTLYLNSIISMWKVLEFSRNTN